jgi:hypothetical protein
MRAAANTVRDATKARVLAEVEVTTMRRTRIRPAAGRDRHGTPGSGYRHNPAMGG